MAAYTLRNIPDDLWTRVKVRAARDEQPLGALLLALLRQYAADAQAAGGRKAAESMTAVERRARAQKAAAARWAP